MAARAAAAGAGVGAGGRPAMRAPRVLIAEGAAPLADGLRRSFGAAGMEVRTAADGLAALCELEPDQPDLLVVDLQLPRVSGFRVVQVAKHGTGGAAPPAVLVLTALSFDEAREAIRAGADDFVGKPCAPAEVAARAQRLLARRAAARRGAGTGRAAGVAAPASAS